MHYATKTKNHTVLFQYIMYTVISRSNLQENYLFVIFYISWYYFDQSYLVEWFTLMLKFPKLFHLFWIWITLYGAANIGIIVYHVCFIVFTVTAREILHMIFMMNFYVFVIFWKSENQHHDFPRRCAAMAQLSVVVEESQTVCISSPYLLLDVWFWMRYLLISSIYLLFLMMRNPHALSFLKSSISASS
jgi:hypothetical protein